MIKLDKNFEFIKFFFPSNIEQNKNNIKKIFYFFDAKHFHIAISISLTCEFLSIIANIFTDLYSNSTNFIF